MNSLITNPIVLGLVAAVVTFSYLYWKEKQRQKEDENAKPKNVNIMIPGVVGALTWFVVGSFVAQPMVGGNVEVEKKSMLPLNSVINKFDENVKLEATDSFGSDSYRLVQKGNIELPNKDVFLDLGSDW